LTHHYASHNVAASETIPDLNLVFFGGTHVLRPDNSRKLLSSRKGDTIDNRYGDEGLQRGQTGDRTKDDGIGGRRTRAKTRDCQGLRETTF